MKKEIKNQMHAERQRKQTIRRIIIFGGIGLVLVIVFVLLGVNSIANAEVGTVVRVDSRNHVPIGSDPGPYYSNPPAGGNHYDTPWPAHFYQESELAALPVHPEGYLVHSLEHGYVIFWYNCNIPGTDCAALKKDIQTVMDETGGTKLIAFPWSSMNVPLAMTSWGRIENFTTLDLAKMKLFVERNRLHSPEPTGE